MAAAKRSMWSRAGRWINILVLGCFFLPFFGVSCDGMDVITISGTDMVGGCRPGGLLAAATDESAKVEGGSIKGSVPDVDVEPIAVAALVLVIALVGVSFLKTRKGTIAGFALSLLAIASLVALYVKVLGDLGGAVDAELGKSSGKSSGKMMMHTDVDAGGRMGLWGAGLGLVASAGLAGAALRRREDDVPPAT